MTEESVLHQDVGDVVGIISDLMIMQDSPTCDTVTGMRKKVKHCGRLAMQLRTALEDLRNMIRRG